MLRKQRGGPRGIPKEEQLRSCKNDTPRLPLPVDCFFPTLNGVIFAVKQTNFGHLEHPDLIRREQKFGYYSHRARHATNANGEKRRRRFIGIHRSEEHTS